MDSLRHRLDELAARAKHVPSAPCAPVPMRASLSDALGGRVRQCGELTCWEVATCFGSACGDQGWTLPASTQRFESTPPAPCASPDGTTPLDPAGTLVIDIETGGFAGTEVFLVGFVCLDSRPLQTVQWLARDYPEELAVLRALAELASRRNTWITFNGKSFDGPFLRDRAVLHRVELAPPARHLDLLHLARRRWRGRVPDCRLRTLEQHVLNWRRTGDVPGSDIPDLFHHFRRTGNAAPLRPVLRHNQLDLIACTELLLRLAEQPAEGDGA